MTGYWDILQLLPSETQPKDKTPVTENVDERVPGAVSIIPANVVTVAVCPAVSVLTV